jgi:hypothetical protein
MSEFKAASVSNQSAPVSGVLQRKCSGCKKKEKEKVRLQRTAVRSSPVRDVPPIVHEVLRSPGQPLDPNTRKFMESRFGHEFSKTPIHKVSMQASSSALRIGASDNSFEREADNTADKVISSPSQVTKRNQISQTGLNFSSVRLHTDLQAAKSAKSVEARAYTIGRDIVFNEGEYAPTTTSGKRLLAHELTHVLQQSIGFSIGVVQRQKCNPPTPRAIAAAQRANWLLNYTRTGQSKTQDDALMWFDDWGDDRRDNDLYGPAPDTNKRKDNIAIDDAAEQGFEDGIHHDPTSDNKDIWRNEICFNESQEITDCEDARIPVWVKYRVCIDVPIGSYSHAGLNPAFPEWKGERDVKKVIEGLRKEDKKGSAAKWRVLLDKSGNPPKLGFSGQFLPGDFLAIISHHSAIYDGSSIINLPGPSRGNTPSGTNDIRIWDESPDEFDFVARLVECTPAKKTNLWLMSLERSGSSQGCEYPNDCPCENPPIISSNEKIEIQFNKDAPQWWYDSASSLNVSLTPDGRVSFNELVSKMQSQLALRTQLEGRASSDRPANDEGYNRRLTDRRVRLIASELEKRGIPRVRLDSPPDQGTPSGCEEIDNETTRGLLSCSDEGAKTPPDPSDRKVVASLFQ